VYDSVGRIAGTGTLGVDGRTLTFVPNAALSVGRPHYVYLSGVKDLFGNAMSASISFTTGYVADATAPKILNTSIQSGQLDIPTNAVLAIKFDEPVSSLSLGNVKLFKGTDSLPMTRQLSGDHSVVYLQPAQALSANFVYTITISGVQDLSGNVLASSRTVTFTTGAGADLAVPVQVSRTPVNGATNVPRNTLIEAQFNERISPISVNDTAVKLYDGTTGLFVAGTPSVSADGKTVRFTPAAALTANRLYYFYTTYNTYVEDLAGNRYSSSSSFTTGSATHTSAPQVLLRSVADGATDIPVNGRLVFQFDTALADRCVTTQTLRVSNGSTPVAGTLSLSGDRTQLTFTPQDPLSVSTAYTVTLDGLCDLAGNALSSMTSSFTTSSTATADTTGPTVTITPAYGATGVSPNTVVTLTFNEAVDVTTLASSIQVTVGGEVAGDLAVNGKVVTFTPSAPLPGNQQISVEAYGVRDLAGNSSNGYAYFTTGAATDVTAPKVVSITPNDKAVDIGSGTPIVLTFSESLNPNTVNNTTFALFVNGNVVQPSVYRSQDNRTVTLNTTLPASSVVAVIVTSGVQDLSGNALADYASVFTTAVATDTSRPSVVSQLPGAGASSVLTDASLVLYTNEIMNEGTLQQALHVSQNGQLVGGTITLNASGQVIVFKPLQPWTPNALVEVFMDNSAQDVNGNALNNYQGSFRIAADPRATAPSVVATQPSYGNTAAPVNAAINMQYSEALDPATVNDTTVILHDNASGQVLTATVSLAKGNRVIHIVPQALLTASHSYYVQTAAGIKDLDGQAAGSYFFYFTTNATATADTVAPKVLAMSPPSGSTNVGINGHVHVRFDESMDPISLLPAQLQTTYESLLWGDNNREVEFMRHQPYAANTPVTESVAGVTDTAGNPVSAPNSVTFTTGNGPDFAVPQITDGTPFNGATNVPVNAVIKLRFNEPLDPVSVNASTAYLYDTTVGPLAGSATLEADGRTITYVPAQALAVGHGHYVYAYGVKDLSGNLAYLYRSFTTALAADAQAPVVTATSLADGLTNVPTNAVVSVAFDEAVNEQSLTGITLSLNGTPVPASPVLSGDHRVVTLKLNQPLQTSAAYVFTISGVQDLSGNVLASSRTVTFTTGAGADLAVPVQVSRTPVNGATNVPRNTLIEAQFNERISPISVNDTAVKLYDGVTGLFVAGTPSVSADGKTVRFTPAAALTANRLYYFYTTYSTYVEDLAGNRYSSSSSFTTGNQ